MNSKSASAWLIDITRDQFLSKIGDIVKTVMTGERRWFASRRLGAGIDYGSLNLRTGRVQLGGNPPETHGLPSSQVNTAAGSATLTVPADHYYYLNYMSVVSSRGEDYSLVYTPAGQTAITLLPAGIVTALANILVWLCGWEPFNTANDVLKPRWLGPGDTMVLTANNYVGGDTITYSWGFIDYTVGI